MNVYRLSNGLYEFPATTLKILGKNFPWSGGGYFRLMPYVIFKWGFCKAFKQNGSVLFYIHPWEIDPKQPRVKGLPKSFSFRHYVGLNKTRTKISKLLAIEQYVDIKSVIQGD